MNTSDFGRKMIAAFEGVRLETYRCPAGVLTIGIGVTGSEARPGRRITREEAFRMFRQFLATEYEPGVRKLLKREPTQGQFDAMVSLAFNIGLGAFARSSVLKFFNRREDEQAAGAFALWNKAKVAGKRQALPGLTRRRSSEALAYQGIQDANFNGRHDSDEPIYGAMPQKVGRSREKLRQSGTAQGAGVAGLGGAGVAIGSAQEALTTAEPHISAGTWIGLALGVTILASAGYALYRRWDDAGRPLPWRGAGEDA
jgi:lysozyme